LKARLTVLLVALPAVVPSTGAGSWSADSARPPAPPAFVGSGAGAGFGDGALLLERDEADSSPGWLGQAPACVLRTVFDPIDGVEHRGTGAWLEFELGLDLSEAGALGGGTAWGAELADWHHALRAWLVRDGTREGVALTSGRASRVFVPLDVTPVRRYRLVADETGGHLSVDGRSVAHVPLVPDPSPGPPRAALGIGSGGLRGRALELGHGCLRPVDVRVAAAGPKARPGRLVVLGDPGLRPLDEVEPGSLLVGDVPVVAGTERERDVDGDGRLDLVVDVPAEALPAPGATVHVDGRSRAGARLRGWSRVSTAGSAAP
jgi:hypothetical protein